MIVQVRCNPLSTDNCEIYCYDEEKVKRVQASLETVELRDTAQLFKALADPTSLKIAYALVQEDELCVCDVANIINSSLHILYFHHQKRHDFYILSLFLIKECTYFTLCIVILDQNKKSMVLQGL